MKQMLLFGVGSPLVVDLEESLARSGVVLKAAIRNRAGESYLIEASKVIDLAAVQGDLLMIPYLVPLFTPANRWQAVREAEQLGLSCPGSLIDASVPCPRAIQHQPGLYVNAGCTLGAASVLDRFVMINRGASIGHHVELGPYVSIGPGAVLGGLGSIGRGSVIGAGAVILPERRIGSNSVVGAGSVVTRDVPDNCLVIGNPARILRTGIAGYKDQEVP